MSAHILLVEDNAADVYLVKQALSEHGIDHHLTVTADADEALRLFDGYESSHDLPQLELILVDVNLPRQDGFTLLKRLRQRPLTTGAAVIVMTSSQARRDHEQAADLGAFFFQKPFELDGFLKLGALVKTLLEGRAAASGSASKVTPGDSNRHDEN